MARLGVSKNKKSPRATELSQLKKELQRVTEQLESRDRELASAIEQQTATSDVLGVISRAPTDLQAVFDTIAEHSVKLCGALFSSVYRFDGELIHMVGHHNYSPAAVRAIPAALSNPAGPTSVHSTGNPRSLGYPRPRMYQMIPSIVSLTLMEFRSVLSVPMLLGDDPIGAITVWHANVGPFSPKHVALLQTFAEQAVIAIENARLFQELTHRTAELEASNSELHEALDQQTATSEILRVITGSPTDLQPVLDAIAESAARLCNAKDAVIRLVEENVLRLAAHKGPFPFFGPSELPIDRGSVTGRAVVDGQPIHIEDLLAIAATEFPEILQAGVERLGDRTQLAVPLVREGVAIGAILIRRAVVDPFTDKQINLLKTFADQAVIAIENVRLFKEIQERNAELREALEHQTATSEVLGIISRSPTDVQPVLDAIVESAARVCGIDDVVLRLREGNNMVSRGSFWFHTPWPRRDQY